MMFRLVASALVLTFSLCQAAPAVLSHLAPYQPAPEGTGIAGQYIISLNAGPSHLSVTGSATMLTNHRLLLR